MIEKLKMPLSPLQKAWYVLTCYIPRRLPENQLQYDYFYKVCLEAYEVIDSPQARATIASQVGAVPGYRLRKAWGHIANQAKRLTINKIAQENKQAAIIQLQKELEEHMK